MRPLGVAAIAVWAIIVGGSLALVKMNAGADAASAPAASSAPPLVHGVNFQIKSVIDETFCMEANGPAATTPAVQLAQCTGRVEQRWTVTDGANGSSVVVGKGGMCWDVDHSVKGPKPLQVSACTYRGNQRFTATPAGLLMEVESGECLTVVAATTSGAVFLDRCQDPAIQAQLWRFAQ
jgi:hypothetical protein